MDYKIIFYLPLWLLLVSGNAFGEWYFGELVNGKLEKKVLNDTAQQLDFHGLTCNVSETIFYRNPNDFISEFRNLECHLTTDISVTTTVNCQKPYDIPSTLFFTIRGTGYTPILTCDYIK